MIFDFETLPGTECYKLMVSTIVPRPIAWVVTEDRAGVLNAAPYSFFNGFSGDPPIIGIGCGHRNGVHKDTLANIEATGQFTVCLVPEERALQMNVTATEFGPEVDELAEAGLTAAPSTKIRPPRIAESPVAMECERFQLVPLGKNMLVLGRILAMHVRDDCVLDPVKHYIDSPKLGLVGRMHGRGWYARTTDRLEIPRMTPAEWAKRKAEEES
ncbi:flavin reductase (DIM6/NTAB) family NADH-FMN oxidoreductase RutF [Humitalea rosea]|uniref:Flavin reductase (DIM6/NTAB) family NADH-FMN oxidoreductase RutF n=1 Tax=Humitalea rosea TaxID=990373 RepID=A0A2W7I1L0_9PROT|nr:flavin reductase family protein [Humitalea rosea]PZW40049.1 flavin reductase (DIM6/NTAB) family NADH-FMN oxidoreductase RutF [Humitalea rosea]